MINKNEVQHISELARINLSDGEIEKFRSDLNKVLGYIEVLKSLIPKVWSRSPKSRDLRTFSATIAPHPRT